MNSITGARARVLSVVAGAFAAAALLAGCGASEPATTASSDDVADRVVAHVQRTLDLTPEVDCGGPDVEIADGTDVECRVTDPETGETYDATVRIIAPDGADFDIDLSVHQRAS